MMPFRVLWAVGRCQHKPPGMPPIMLAAGSCKLLHQLVWPWHVPPLLSKTTCCFCSLLHQAAIPPAAGTWCPSMCHTRMCKTLAWALPPTGSMFHTARLFLALAPIK